MLVLFKEEVGETAAEIPLTNISPASYTDLPRAFTQLYVNFTLELLMSPAACSIFLLVLAQQPVLVPDSPAAPHPWHAN